MANYKTIIAADLERLVTSNKVDDLIDVREDYEYSSGHVSKAINMPLSTFDISKLDKKKNLF